MPAIKAAMNRIAGASESEGRDILLDKINMVARQSGFGPLPEGAVTSIPPKTAEEMIAERACNVREERDARIREVRWLIERHRDEQDERRATSLSMGQYQALLTYIQALRDVPAQSGFPWDGGGDGTPWPVKPL
ncbi:hypothetical protein CNY67_14440 [Desulfovibrio sp. G11]|nr:hypothetical protein CNY67_14440 [Desulfovibrio sp. G11]